MIEMLEKSSGNIVGIRMSGKLHDADYKEFVPKAEAIIEKEGSIRMLVIFEDFHGWDTHACWDDFAFGMKHKKDIERFAIVTDKKWLKWSMKLSAPLINESKVFEPNQEDEAWAWIAE